MARLLLVDDEPDLLDVVAETLRARGHEVEACTCGRDARARIAGPTTLDAAILDWSLPDVSGRDLLLDLEARQPQAKVIIVTGYGESIVSASLVNDRVLAVIRKPFRLREILAILDSLADGTKNDLR